MRPEEYLLIVLRRWWLVVLAAVVAAVIAFGYTSAQPKTYQTSTQMMAIAQPPDYWLDLYAKNRLASYTSLINNWDFVAKALQQANLDIDPSQVMGKLAVGHNPDANIIQIVMTDTDPQRAAKVVNALADAFVAKSAADDQQIIKNYTSPTTQTPAGTVQITKLETPSAPTTPNGPRVKLNTAAAALLGLVFGIILTFVVEYFDDTLRSEDDVDRYLELPTLVGIPRD
jgi:capsular polysaccharide biosynthesis protein